MRSPFHQLAMTSRKTAATHLAMTSWTTAATAMTMTSRQQQVAMTSTISKKWTRRRPPSKRQRCDGLGVTKVSNGNERRQQPLPENLRVKKRCTSWATAVTPLAEDSSGENEQPAAHVLRRYGTQWKHTSRRQLRTYARSKLNLTWRWWLSGDANGL